MTGSSSSSNRGDAWRPISGDETSALAAGQEGVGIWRNVAPRRVLLEVKAERVEVGQDKNRNPSSRREEGKETDGGDTAHSQLYDAMTSECHEHDAMRVLLAMKKGVCEEAVFEHYIGRSRPCSRLSGFVPKERSGAIHLAVLRALCCQMTGIWCDRCVTPARTLGTLMGDCFGYSIAVKADLK